MIYGTNVILMVSERENETSICVEIEIVSNKETQFFGNFPLSSMNSWWQDLNSKSRLSKDDPTNIQKGLHSIIPFLTKLILDLYNENSLRDNWDFY